MKHDSQKHQRRSMRLKGYDYAQPGAYFVTLCTWQRECLFGEVVNGEMRLSSLGRIVEDEWERLGSQFSNITLDAFVVMPNHVHGIIVINEPDVGATHTMRTMISSGNQPVPIETVDARGGSPKWVTHDSKDGENRATRRMDDDAEDGDHSMRLDSGVDPYGSPDQVMANRLERENRATRHSQTDASNDDRYDPTESGGWVDGSPLQNDVEWTNQNSSPEIGVGATHNRRTMISSGNQPVHIESLDTRGGSPVNANDGLSDIHETVTQRTAADSLERENRATRRMDNDAEDGDHSMRLGFGVDPYGSPLRNDGDRAPKGPAGGSLGAMIGQFKSRVTKRIWAIPEYSHVPIWQRNYYEHIIRNEIEWGQIYEYIQDNPLKWDGDQLHPDSRPNPTNQDKQHG